MTDTYLISFLNMSEKKTHTGFPSLGGVKCFQLMKKLADGIAKKREDLTHLHKLVERVTYEF